MRVILAGGLVLIMVFLGAGCRGSRWAAPKTAETPPLLTADEMALNVESFDTIHRTIAESHYDPELGGVDWAALGDSLRPLVASARTMSEARVPMQTLINSLGQSHFVIYPGDVYADAAAGRDGGTDLLDGDVRVRSKTGRPGESGMTVRVLEGVPVVTEVLTDSPAGLAGVRPGWLVTHVGTVELAPRLEKLTQALAGESGSAAEYILNGSVLARLAGDEGDILPIDFLDHQDAARHVELTLGPAEGQPHTMGNLPEVHVWTRQEVLEGDIAYFRFNYFLDVVTVMSAFNKAMGGWLDKPGVIIDVRGNPGGIGAMATGMASWFAREKGLRLGTMIMRSGKINFILNKRAKGFVGKVAVLTDGMSASTSEIFAGGMKDLGLGRVFGTRTAGAALPSYIIKLPNGDGFQYAVANYISEGGDVLEGQGVEPDVIVVPTRENLRSEGDPVREAARLWLLNQ